jgi:hypothetical protein
MAPKPWPWMITLAFSSACFKGKGEACAIIEFEGEEGVSHAVNAVKMVDNKPHIFDFICTNFNGICPRFISISSGSPKEISYIVEPYGVAVDVGRRRPFTI